MNINPQKRVVFYDTFNLYHLLILRFYFAAILSSRLALFCRYTKGNKPLRASSVPQRWRATLSPTLRKALGAGGDDFAKSGEALVYKAQLYNWRLCLIFFGLPTLRLRIFIENIACFC